MSKFKKSWMAALVGAILLGTLAGVVWARPRDRPEAQDITRKITVPGAFFRPVEEGMDWYNDGRYIRMDSGDGTFAAPVVFPCLPSVTVERLILYADDTHGTYDACAYLYRTRPHIGDEAVMGEACSSGTTTGVQPFIDSSISPNVVWPAHGVYIWLRIFGQKINVHAVRVEYHRNI